MRRRIFSILLAGFMIFTMTPLSMAGESQEGIGTAAKIGDNEYKTLASAIEAAEAASSDAGRTVILADDVQENITINEGGTVILDLNGHVLKGDGSDSAITNNGVLTINDSGNTEHYWIPDDTGLWILQESRPENTPDEDYFITKGGVITGSTTDNINGGGVYNDGTLTINGGCICGNAVYNRGGYGGGVYNEGTLTINGGSICGNTATQGGGVCNYFIYDDDKVSAVINGGVITGNTASYGGGVENYSKLTVNDCSITGNTAKESGGGIYNESDTELNILGGSITGNTAGDNCGGVSADGIISIGGNTKITGNLCGGKANNFVLYDGYEGMISICSGDNAPAEDMSIGISRMGWNSSYALIHTSGPFTTNGTADDVKYFTSDDNAFKVKYVEASGGDEAVPAHLELVEKKAAKIKDKVYPTLASAIEAAEAVSADAADADRTVILIDDVQESITIHSSGKVILDLNGHMLTGTGGNVISVFGTLTIKDSGDAERFWIPDGTGLWKLQESRPDGTEGTTYFTTKGGVITGGGNGSGVWSSGTVTMTGGNICGNHANQGGGMMNIGTLNMTGGNICGNTASTGGGVLNTGTPSMTLDGGTIFGNTARSGGGVYSTSSTLTVKTGAIRGNTADTGGGVYNDLSELNCDGGSISGNSGLYGAGVYNSGNMTVKGTDITGNTAKFFGGGIFNNQNKELNILGGNITGNTAANGSGGVRITGSNVSVGGSARITGNSVSGKDDDPDKDSNLDIIEGKINICSDDDKPSEDMKIGIILEAYDSSNALIHIAGPFTNNGTADDVKYFTSDDNAFEVKYVEASGGDEAVPAHLELVEFVKKAQTITADDVEATYGDKNVKITASASGGGKLSYTVKEGTDVISVDDDGIITIKKAGSAVVTVKAEETDYYAEAFKDVEVKIDRADRNLAFESVVVSRNEGDAAFTNVLNGITEGVTYSSSNTSVASVDSATGIVTIAGQGSAVITASALDSDCYNKDSAQFTLNVSHSHSLKKVEANAPSCTEPGNNEYWICSGCGKYFSDAEGKESIEENSWVIPAKGHDISKHAAVEETCTKSGNSEYYDCSVCGKYFSDAAGNNEITKDKWFIPAKGHSPVEKREDKKPEGYDLVVYCDVCDDIISTTSVKFPFKDVSTDDWFFDDVFFAWRNGLVSGMSEHRYGPDIMTTRAMIATLLYRMEGSPEVSGTSQFSDVESGSWYENAVIWASDAGVVKGMSETEFAPDQNITREQMALMIYRFAQYKGADVSARADLSGYKDADMISDFAVDALSWANACGIIKGIDETTIDPQGGATRAQAAAVLHRIS